MIFKILTLKNKKKKKQFEKYISDFIKKKKKRYLLYI